MADVRKKKISVTYINIIKNIYNKVLTNVRTTGGDMSLLSQ